MTEEYVEIVDYLVDCNNDGNTGGSGQNGGSGNTGSTGGGNTGDNGGSGNPTGNLRLPLQLSGGLSLKQIDTVLSLVSVAENSDTKWYNQYNYIENINDGRGYTISIVGFCTGTGDFIQVLEALQKINPNHILVKWIPLVRTKKGGDVRGLDGLPADMAKVGVNDKDFNMAAWIVIQKLYWGPAMDYCNSHGFTSALAKYITYDTILNFGELNPFSNIRVSASLNEKSAIAKFLEIKQRVIVNDPTLGDSKNNRVDMQKSLLQRSIMDLQTPMTVSCYGDSFIIN